MVLKASQERVKTLLKDTITLLCKNGLEFQNNFTVEAVIGITLDNSDVFLISMNEIIKSEKQSQQQLLEDVSSPQSADTTTERQDGPKFVRNAKRKWNSDEVKVKEEPTNQEESGDSFNPQAEDLWPGGEPPSLSPSTLEEVGAESLPIEGDERPPPSKKSKDNNDMNEALDIKLEQRDEDDESDEDLVFIKQEAKDYQSCSQVKSPLSATGSQNYRQTYGRSQSLSSDMNLTSMGMNDSSMQWSQSMQQYQSRQQHQQQQPQQQQQQVNYPLRMSRTSTVTSDVADQSQLQGDQQNAGSGQQQVSWRAENGRFHCLLCSKTFKSLFSIKSHVDIHNCKYRYHCTYCDKGFMATNDLRAHLSYHTGIPEFKCSVCGKEYRYRRSLIYHMAGH